MDLAADEDQLHDMWNGQIFLSNLNGAQNKVRLELLGITDIINLSGSDSYELPKECQRFSFLIDDVQNADILSLFEPCHRLIDESLTKNGRVLVHCVKGASRSATIIISWLMTRRNMPLATSLRHCKNRRHAVRPNNGFFKKLRVLDLELFGAESMPLDEICYVRWCNKNRSGEFHSARGCTISWTLLYLQQKKPNETSASNREAMDYISKNENHT